MISILRCDPPQSSDVRESIEAARALSCTTLTFIPLGEELPGSTLTPLACHVLCLLSLMDLAPALVLGGAGVYPRVPLPTPDTIGKPTVATIGMVASGVGGKEAVTHVFLGRGVGEWLVEEAPPGTADAWKSALPDLVGCLIGGGGGKDTALGGTMGALLGCPSPPHLASLGSSKGIALAVGSGGYHHRHEVIDDALIPPSALSFLTRQSLLGRGCGGKDHADPKASQSPNSSIPWWRAHGIPDVWHKPADQSSHISPSTGSPLMTLPPAPTLDPSPPPPTSTILSPDTGIQPSQTPSHLPWRVAILGGSFNPPTLAHTLLASQVLSSGSADEVWVVPCGPRADKGSVGTSSLQRVILTALAVEGGGNSATSSSSNSVNIGRVITLPLELYEEGALATVDLLARLEALVGGERVIVEGEEGERIRRRGREVQFSLVIGTDALPSLPSWRHPQRLMTNARFIVCPRPGYEEGGGGKGEEGKVWPRLAVWINGVGGSPTSSPMPYAAVQLSSSEVRLRAKEAGGKGALAVCAALNALLCNHVAVYVSAMGVF